MPLRTHTERLGDYDLVGELGSGGFGTVYEARKHRIDKPVALKVLHAHMVKDPEAVLRFEREAKAAARFRHPHIVSVSDVGEVDGAHFIEMELLDGECLKTRLEREGALPLRAALDVLLPVFSAVVEVHAKGIVHRDIKPANVFLTSPLPGVVHPKLLDFGVAKLRDGTQELTESAAFLGSMAYMSPEQMFNAKGVDARSDQWSLAVMTYQCLTGRLPFTATTVPEMVTAVLSAPFPRPRELDPGIPADVEAAILRAMEREPERRHASVRDFGAALLAHAGVRARETYAGQLLSDTTPPPPETPVVTADVYGATSRALRPVVVAAEPRSRKAVLVGAATVTSLLVFGVGGWMVTRPSRDRSTPDASARVVASPSSVLDANAATDGASEVIVASPVRPPEASSVEPAAAPAARARRAPHERPSRHVEPVVDAGVAVGSRGVTIL